MDYPSYLIHYGIQGQKWGIRRFQNEDGTWTPEGLERRKSGENNFTKYGSKDVKTTDEKIEKMVQKQSNKKVKEIDQSKSQGVAGRIIKDCAYLALGIIGLRPDIAISSAADLTVGVSGTIKKKSALKKHESNQNIDAKTGFKLKANADATQKQDAKAVNPGYHNFDENTKNNCMLCTNAYELRRRGFDAIAKDATIGYFTKDIKKWFPKSKVENSGYISKKHPQAQKVVKSEIAGTSLYTRSCWILNHDKKYKKEMASSTIESLSKTKNSRGNILVRWGDGGGHSMAYEVKDGKVSIIDAQTGKVYNDKSVEKLLNKTIYSQWSRLDNVDFNKKEIKKVVRV